MSDRSDFVRAPGLARLVADNRDELRRYFHMLARASIAGGALTASACGGFSADLYDRPVCEGTAPRLFDESALLEHDFVGAYAAPDGRGSVSLVSAIGTQCGGASDPAGCEVTLMEARDLAGSRFVLTTRGDTITGHRTPEEIDAHFGDVTSATDAQLRVWARGYSISCEDPQRGGVREVEGGWEVVATRYEQICNPILTVRTVFFVAHDGTVTALSREEISRQDGACIGRRPEGLIRARRAETVGRSDVDRRDPVGLFFARIAHLEAAAVPAFEILARELEALGAPRALVSGARAAAADEVRHAIVTSAIARRRGVEPAPIRIAPRPLRDRLALARDNVAEGCVRETFGALVGTYQAMRAEDDDIAEAMVGIAADETGHAALSHAIATWALTGIDDEPSRESLRAERRRAIAVLREEAHAEHDPVVARAAGLPAPALAVSWVDRLDRDLPT
jgi:hypothetical protein